MPESYDRIGTLLWQLDAMRAHSKERFRKWLESTTIEFFRNSESRYYKDHPQTGDLERKLREAWANG
jgi:hypothetical protein